MCIRDRKDTKPHVKVIIVLSARIPHFVLFLKGIKNQGVKEKMFQKKMYLEWKNPLSGKLILSLAFMAYN